MRENKMDKKIIDEEEDVIDLGLLLQIMKKNKKKLFLIIIICTLLALLLAFILPKKYESIALVRTNDTQGLGKMEALAALSLASGASSPTMAYIEMMKSRTVIEPIIELVDLPKEKKEEMLIKDFVKDYLDIKNLKATNLIEITATGKTSEEAQNICSNVVHNFLSLMTHVNQNTQSLMLNFLNERITVSKEEAEVAEQKLLHYSQAHKIYSPEEQTKADLKKLTAFDKALAEAQVLKDSNEAKLLAVNEHLGEQNINLEKFQIADHEGIASLRQTLINKNIALVNLRQKYQEIHPSIIALKKEIEALKENLTHEINTAVEAGTVTLNPAQAELIKEKTLSIVSIRIAEATLKTLQTLQAQAEKNIEGLSENSLEYLKLQRDASVKNEIYLMLVKNAEQAKIQKTMESMDIQIIDEANLPKKEAFPKKSIFLVAGFFLGILISIFYSFLLYKKA